MKDYHKQTTYTHPEDLKRLDFIVGQVQQYDKATARVLDIGCGNGNITLAIGSLGYTIKGIDIDQGSVENARRRNTFPNVTFEVLDANSFNISDEFDVVICSEVLEHLITPSELVQSAYKILKPGGTMVVTVPNGFGPREVIMTKPMQWMMRKGYGKTLAKIKRAFGYRNATEHSSNPDLTHTQFFTKKALYDMMQKVGFKFTAFGKSDSFNRIFPYSILAGRSKALMRLDCKVADALPVMFASGFYSAWKK